MKNLICGLILCVVFTSFVFGQIKKSADRENAPASKEIVSKECKFKIQFPREPKVEVSQFGSTVIRDFKVTESQSEWRVLCSDDKDFVADETLKERYAQSAENVVRENQKLISRRDINLNGRLGVEFIIEDAELITTTRAFLITNRLYQIVFKQNKKATNKLNFSAESFFDSFDFWTEENKK